jgi:hypothetical protein
MRLTDWLFFEVALLLIGLTKISLTKSRFNPPLCNRIVSQAAPFGHESPKGIFRAISNSADISKRLLLVINERIKVHRTFDSYKICSSRHCQQLSEVKKGR